MLKLKKIGSVELVNTNIITKNNVKYFNLIEIINVIAMYIINP